MFEYMRTVLNGLKAWVTGEVNKLLSKIDAVGAVASRASNTATKNKNDVAVLGNSLRRVKGAAETAQSTAETAQSTAETAQSTANAAQTAAETAQSTADLKLGARIVSEPATISVGTVTALSGGKFLYDLGILNGSIITATTDLETLTAVWDGFSAFFPFRQGNLVITLLPNGRVYEFTMQLNQVNNLSISYQKASAPQGRIYNMLKGAWLPPYTIAPFLYLASATDDLEQASTGHGRKIFKITVDDAGTLSATEVTTS